MIEVRRFYGTCCGRKVLHIYRARRDGKLWKGIRILIRPPRHISWTPHVTNTSHVSVHIHPISLDWNSHNSSTEFPPLCPQIESLDRIRRESAARESLTASHRWRARPRIPDLEQRWCWFIWISRLISVLLHHQSICVPIPILWRLAWMLKNPDENPTLGVGGIPENLVDIWEGEGEENMRAVKLTTTKRTTERNGCSEK